MNANSFGQVLKMTTFGESHGPAMGVVIDGCPAGVHFDYSLLLADLARRRPGNNKIGVSARNETDSPEILSGVFEEKTLGTPIAILIRNQDARSEDYKKIKKNPRAGHADDMWKIKFAHSDPRGGGRSSGRETVCRVAAGAVAKMILNQLGLQMKIVAFAQQVGPFRLTEKTQNDAKMLKALQKAQFEGESWGGTVQVLVKNPPVGMGQPVFHKLKSDLAAACMSIGATAGFEIGDGFAAAQALGSKFHTKKSSQYGGIRGGLSTGEQIQMRVAFKPTSSILDIAKKGRHDPCIVLRAVPVVESMVAFVMADHILWQRLDRIKMD